MKEPLFGIVVSICDLVIYRNVRDNRDRLNKTTIDTHSSCITIGSKTTRLFIIRNERTERTERRRTTMIKTTKTTDDRTRNDEGIMIACDILS